jgi:hypothetical protein
MPTRPERPPDAEYYKRERVELFSQGDLFRDVPLAYPMPADDLIMDEAPGEGGRRFLSGPLRFGPAMLITPNCSLSAQGVAGYSHPVRTLVPVIPDRSRERHGGDRTRVTDAMRRRARSSRSLAAQRVTDGLAALADDRSSMTSKSRPVSGRHSHTLGHGRILPPGARCRPSPERGPIREPLAVPHWYHVAHGDESSAQRQRDGGASPQG